MGTNYYAKLKNKTLAEIFPDLHIGKSSCGWYFNLHVYPEKGINNLEDWKKVLSNKSIEIQNEYGEKIELGDLVDTITNRDRSKEKIKISSLETSCDDWSAVDKKRKLLYMKENVRYGWLGPEPGGGTWTLATCDFS